MGKKGKKFTTTMHTWATSRWRRPPRARHTGEDTGKIQWNPIHMADLVSTIQPAGCYVMPRTYELEPIRHVGATRICPACGNTRMRIITVKPSDQFGLDEFAYQCVCGEETVCVMTRARLNKGRRILSSPAACG
jgi:hypothetical protein